MVKVLVVDDEFFVREGMRRTINWDSIGCDLVGEAENAYEAIEKARNLKPDIIITDIKMPGMDGISMSKEIRQELKECQFIIMTGYDEFDYAKAAIKLKAVDFLLKPVDNNELLEALQKAIMQHEKMKMEKNIMLEQIILDALRDNFHSKDEMCSLLQSCGISFKNILVILLENDNYVDILETSKERVLYDQNKVIKKIIHEHFKTDCYTVECHRDRIAVLINYDSRKDITIEEELRRLQEKILIVCGTTVTIGLSSKSNLLQIGDAYKQAKKAIENKIYTGKNSINKYMDITYDKTAMQGLILDIKKELKLALNAVDKQKAEKLIKKLYFDIFTNYKVEEHVIRQNSIEILAQLNDIVKEYGKSVFEVFGKNFNAYQQAENLHTLKELYEMVILNLEKAANAIRLQRSEVEESGVEKALEYIKANYSKDISLSDVAKKCYLSESYLSRRMKQVYGIGFSEYITRLRVEKAIEYLKRPGAKITEVAARVGYSDYRYFSQIFKKSTGYSPSEFVKSKN